MKPKMLSLLGQAFMAAHKFPLVEEIPMKQWPYYYENMINYLKLISSRQVHWYVENHEHEIVGDTPLARATIIALLNVIDTIPPLDSRQMMTRDVKSLALLSFGRLRICLKPRGNSEYFKEFPSKSQDTFPRTKE
jgi:hypothetical protein